MVLTTSSDGRSGTLAAGAEYRTDVRDSKIVQVERRAVLIVIWLASGREPLGTSRVAFVLTGLMPVSLTVLALSSIRTSERGLYYRRRS